MIVTELSGVIEDEVIGDEFDWRFREVGLIHHRSVHHFLTPLVFFERSESAFFGATLTVGSDKVKRLLFERFGQTDHPWSEMLATYSSAPNDEQGNLSFQV